MTRVVLVVAVAEGGVIGAAGGMPWHLPDDLKRFKRLTMGHPMIMGRKTWESIGRALPGRTSIVVTRQRDFRAEGAEVVATLDDALSLARKLDGDVAFIIGGGEIYKQALPMADAIEMTRIHAHYDGDVRFPDFDEEAWRETSREDHETADGLGYSFLTLERRGRHA